jgi:beta-glucanase (GH16 family)
MMRISLRATLCFIAAFCVACQSQTPIPTATPGIKREVADAAPTTLVVATPTATAIPTFTPQPSPTPEPTPSFSPSGGASSLANWRIVFYDNFDVRSWSLPNGGNWQTCDFYGLDVPPPQTCDLPETATGKESYSADNVLGPITEGDVTFARLQARRTANGYTSGMLNTRRAFNFKYGYMEARLRFPQTTNWSGLWPAFWATPARQVQFTRGCMWPPEIDALEIFGDPKFASTTYHFIKTPGQCGISDLSQDASIGAKHPPPNGATFADGQWHIFGVDWQPQSLAFFIDGREVFRLRAGDSVDANLPNNPQPFKTTLAIPDLPMYLVLNMHIGGYAGNPDSTDFPQHYDVDYVRVWQTAETPDAVVDDLKDFDRAFGFSDGLKFDQQLSEFFGGDASRVYRQFNTPEHIVWQMTGMKTFVATTFFQVNPKDIVNDAPKTHFAFLTSADNLNYQPIEPQIETVGKTDWMKATYSLRLPPNTRFVKLVFPTNTVETWTPAVSAVTYSR